MSNSIEIGATLHVKAEAGRGFHVRTYGCQMNVHDSEKLANLLLHAGWRDGGDAEAADLLLINTCSIREKAEHRLYSDLGALREWKAARPGRVLGVGGCVAQQEGDALLRRFPHLDFAFGTHNLRLVPALAEAAARRRARRARGGDALPRALRPPRAPPRLRRPRPAKRLPDGDGGLRPLLHVLHRAADARPRDQPPGRGHPRRGRGARRERRARGDPARADRQRLRPPRPPQGTRRRRCRSPSCWPRIAAVPGIDRIRYTSPHPVFFDDALIRAHGELPALCPHVHLPAQSGSDARARRACAAATARTTCAAWPARSAPPARTSR